MVRHGKRITSQPASGGIEPLGHQRTGGAKKQQVARAVGDRRLRLEYVDRFSRVERANPDDRRLHRGTARARGRGGKTAIRQEVRPSMARLAVRLSITEAATGTRPVRATGRCRASGVTLNRMMLSRLRCAQPRRHHTTGWRPAVFALFQLAAAKNATKRLSGDQKGTRPLPCRQAVSTRCCRADAARAGSLSDRRHEDDVTPVRRDRQLRRDAGAPPGVPPNSVLSGGAVVNWRASPGPPNLMPGDRSRREQRDRESARDQPGQDAGSPGCSRRHRWFIGLS